MRSGELSLEKAVETTEDTESTDLDELAKAPPFPSQVTKSWARPMPNFFDPWHPWHP